MIPPLWNKGHAVKKSRFAEEQIAFALKQAELGTKGDEICRKMGMLTVVDGYSRESLAIHVGQSLKWIATALRASQ